MEKELHWSRMASDFEKRVYYVAGKQNIEEVQRTLVSQRMSGKVLELGCGNGTYSTLIAAKAEKFYATDFSDQMVAISKDRLKPLSNITVEKQNCFDLSYPDASFDCVVMVNLLHVVMDPEKVISESRRVLKSGGKIIVASFTTEGMKFFDKIGMIYRYLRAFGKPPAKSKRLTVNRVKEMLEDEGFKIDEARLIGITSKAVFVTAVAGGGDTGKGIEDTRN